MDLPLAVAMTVASHHWPGLIALWISIGCLFFCLTFFLQVLSPFCMAWALIVWRCSTLSEIFVNPGYFLLAMACISVVFFYYFRLSLFNRVPVAPCPMLSVSTGAFSSLDSLSQLKSVGCWMLGFSLPHSRILLLKILLKHTMPPKSVSKTPSKSSRLSKKPMCMLFSVFSAFLMLSTHARLTC